ncbi:MAG: gluconokinase [Bacteroidota bacterium]
MNHDSLLPIPTVIYLMGVSGSGKTTIGKALAARLQLPFYDGDDFHPEENVAKMAAGIPLQDDDRWSWLEAIRIFAKASIVEGASLVIACSALKEQYRVVLQEGLSSEQVRWVYLVGDYELIWSRMRARTNHFMPASLLQSQFDALEPPKDCLEVAVTRSVPEAVAQIVDSFL